MIQFGQTTRRRDVSMRAEKQVLLDLLRDRAGKANLTVKHYEISGLDDILFTTLVSDRGLRLDSSINLDYVNSLKISYESFVELLVDDAVREFLKYKVS